MTREVLDFLDAGQGGVFVDATFGGGGHTQALLAANPANRVVACDRDAAALDAGRQFLGADAPRVEFLHEDYRNLPAIIQRRDDLEPRGVVVDMGISTLQLLDPTRGFAFSLDGPLDMRLDRSSGRTAADLVNDLPEPDLRRIITRLGEERHANRVSRAIVDRRARRPFTGTAELAAVVREAIPAAVRRKLKIDAATKTFQALRIAVNDELSEAL